MKKQHAWALLTSQAQALLEPNMAQPSGEYVTVMGNDGNPMQVLELHGGFALISEIGSWRMVIGCGMKSAFDAMVAQLQVVGNQLGHPVGVLLAIVDDVDGTGNPDYTMLDIAIPSEAKQSVDAWLATIGITSAPNGAYRNVIEYVGDLFRGGFMIGQDSIS
jgi:hypothetical protein